MNKTLLETINLKKNFEHKNGIIELFNNVNMNGFIPIFPFHLKTTLDIFISTHFSSSS